MATNGSRKLFVNLPVRDLERAKAFFTRLGFTFNPEFTDDSAACMVISDEAFAMLLVEARFKDFTPKQICNTATHTEGLFALSVGSRAEVDQMVKTAIAAGGSHAADPMDHGFMYGWSFYDLDGHHWEVFHMEAQAKPANPVVHFEVMASGDVEAVRRFYADVFGWKIDTNNPMNYGLIDTGGGGIRGGIGQPMSGSSYATFYVQVDDLQGALDRIASRGGTTIMSPMDVPGGEVSIAMFKDPAGNMIGLVRQG